MVLMGLVASTTKRIRVGSGAVLLGHHTTMSVVEHAGTLDALFPGRIDLGMGRSGHRYSGAGVHGGGASSTGPRRDQTPGVTTAVLPKGTAEAHRRIAQWAPWLFLPGARPLEFGTAVNQILAMLDGGIALEGGVELHVVPGERGQVWPWIMAGGPGESAQVAAERGLPLVVGYHVVPTGARAAVDAYRAAFKPSAEYPCPHVMVSADVVVGSTDAIARELASPYGLWVLRTRTSGAAEPFPSPQEAAAHRCTEEERSVVSDRVGTQFVGSPGQVVRALKELQSATSADELIITTITHGHDDRVRSYELLAHEWSGSH